MIDLKSLPKEIQDRLELKEDSDPTFVRAIEENYTRQMFETMNHRRRVDVEHSYLTSIYGGQGCHLKGQKIFINRRKKWKLINIEDVCIGDRIVSLDKGKYVEGNVVSTFHYKDSEVLNINFKRGESISITGNHKMFTIRDRKIVHIKADDIKVGDRIIRWVGMNKKVVKNKDYYYGFVSGCYIADGCSNVIVKCDNDLVDIIIEYGKRAGMNLKKWKNRICIPESENLRYLGSNSIKYVRDFSSLSYLRGILDGYLICDSGLCYYVDKNGGSCTQLVISSKSKELINQIQFLLLYFYGVNSDFKKLNNGSGYLNSITCSSSDSRKVFIELSKFSCIKSDKAKKILSNNFKKDYSVRGRFLPASFEDFDLKGMSSKKNKVMLYLYSALKCSLKKGYLQDNSINRWSKNKYLSNFFDDYKEYFKYFSSEVVSSISYSNGDVYDIEVEKYHNYVLSNGFLSSNSGKSWGGLFISGYMSQNFNIDNIYFDVDELVKDRKNLKSHTSVQVDEQMGAYGVDSHRISVVLGALKEQLRKKSIHMTFCSPILKEEYKSSHYALESMFIDEERQEGVFAYKTNELKCLGYVRIPHPLNSISKELLKAYEEKKDEHLEQLTENPKDEVEERAEMVMSHAVFKQAESVYIESKGFVPYKNVVQLISKIFPDYKSSAIVFEIADRIKLNKEVSGEWLIP